MKAKCKFRLNGQTIEKDQEIPKDMEDAARIRGYGIKEPSAKTKPEK